MCDYKDLLPKISDFDFAACYRVEPDGRIKMRLLALHHLQAGKNLTDVADMVLTTDKTLRNWLKLFIEFDYEGLIEKEGRGRRPRLPYDSEDAFRDALTAAQDETQGGSIDGKAVQQLLLDKFDCNYSLNGVYSLLDRLNIVWISGRSKHPKSSNEVQEIFKQEFPEQAKILAQKLNQNQIEVWWQDEARVGQRGTISRIWASKGTRPRVVRQQQFQSTYIFGAVCPDKDKGVGLILPQANAGMMQMHLDQISLSVDEGFHAIIMMDRASWHTTEALNIPKNISLFPLPPYSPELNPVEQIWQQLRRHSLSNRTFKDYDDSVQSCSQAWNTFVDEEGRIKNLCSRGWAKIGN